MLRHIASFRPFYEGDAGGGSGAGGQGGGTGGSDPAAAFANLMARSSDAAALARQLFEENFRYRTELREAQGKIPAQGAAVLTAEQATAWAAYQQLGAPDAVQTTIQQAKQLQRDLQIRDVAAASGYTLDVLRTLAGDLQFEVRDETKDNQPVQAVYVKVDGKDVPVEQYATEKWAAFLPALKPAAQANGQQQIAPNTGATNPAAQRGAQQQAQFDPKNPPRLSDIPWKK
jgi:hypothetical protein